MAEGSTNSNNVNRFKGVPDKIAEEIQSYENTYFMEDLPVPLCGQLSLYPVTVHQYNDFLNCISCLTLNKNESPEGVRMSHLEYLYYMTQKPNGEGAMWSYRIQKLFEIIFQIKNGIKCIKCGEVIEYNSVKFQTYLQQVQATQQNEQVPLLVCDKEGCQGTEFIERMKFIEDPTTKKHVLSIDGQIINKDDYNRLRYIVLYQNIPDYRDDSWVDPDLKRDYEEKMRLERKNNDAHATIEKKAVCLFVYTHLPLPEIYNMSIRKFVMALTAVDDLINYQIMKTASLSGFVQWPKDKPIDHWIYKPDRDMFGDAYKTIEQATSGMV